MPAKRGIPITVSEAFRSHSHIHNRRLALHRAIDFCRFRLSLDQPRRGSRGGQLSL